MVVCVIALGIFAFTYSSTNSSNLEPKKSDIKHVIIKVMKYQYNKNDGSIDLYLWANVPDGTKGYAELYRNGPEHEYADNDFIFSTGDLEFTIKNKKAVAHFKKKYIHDYSGDVNAIDMEYINGEYNADIKFYPENLKSYFRAGLSKKERKKKSYSLEYNFNLKDSISFEKFYKQYKLQMEKEAEQEKKDKAEAAREAKQEIADKKSSTNEIKYAELEKDPLGYKGVYAKYHGKIVQIMEDNGETIIRLAVTKNAYGWSYSDILFVTYEGRTKFVKNDVVTVYGSLNGSKTYESGAGYHITIPSIKAEFID